METKYFSFNTVSKSLESFIRIENDPYELIETIEKSDGTVRDLTPVTVVKVDSTEQYQEFCQKLSVFFKGLLSPMDRIINFDPDSESIRRGNQGHPLHTDGNFESRFVECFTLHFEKIDKSGGGQSIFAPVDWIFERIPDHHLKTLLENPVFFSHKDSKGKVDKIYQNFVIRKHPEQDGQLIINYANDSQVDIVPQGDYKKVREAICCLHELVLDSPKVIYTARENQVIIIKNYATLHGRLPILSSSPRIVNRFYLGVKKFYTGLEEFEHNSGNFAA